MRTKVAPAIIVDIRTVFPHKDDTEQELPVEAKHQHLALLPSSVIVLVSRRSSFPKISMAVTPHSVSMLSVTVKVFG
jgi:hypothetical protein